MLKIKEFCKADREHLPFPQIKEILEANGQDSTIFDQENVKQTAKHVIIGNNRFYT